MNFDDYLFGYSEAITGRDLTLDSAFDLAGWNPGCGVPTPTDGRTELFELDLGLFA